jgi:hypothetical protein
MKISFNTQTVTLPELMIVRSIIEQVHEQLFQANTVDIPDTSGADRVYFASREVEPNPVSHVTAVKSIEPVADIPNTFTVEFEPDDEDVSPDSITYEQIANAPCVKSGEASVEGIIREFESMTDIVVERPINQIPSPPITQPVIPPPPPQVAAEVSARSVQGIADEDFDSDGVMWDATVHSESRAKNVDGTWRKRRNTKNVEVKAAIKGLEAITPNSVPAPPAERKMVRTFVRIDGGQNLISAPEGATDEELSAITGKPTMREDRYQTVTAEPVVPAPPSVSAAPPPPPPVVKTAAPGAPAGTFNELMECVTKHFAAQKITSVDLAEICKTFNIGSMQECFTQTHLIPLVSNAIDQKAASK